MSDYRDPELENMLGRLSGAYPDANTAYVAVTGRVRQVKRRRAFVASTAACVVLFGIGALAVRGGGQPSNVSPAADSSVTSVESSVDDDSSSTSDDATSSSVDTSSSIDPASSVSIATASSVSDSSTKPTSSSSSSSSSSTSAGNSVVATSDGTTTHTSAGGSIVVSLTNGALSLVSDAPADGFTTTVKHDRPDRVEVEFSDGSTTWRIRIDLVNGSAVEEITQHGG